MTRKKILVFPCGSEIGLEIHRALRYSSHVEVVGASSVDDHGRFVYENYIGNFPKVTDPEFIHHVRRVILDHAIDAIYPTMDEVILKLKKNEQEVGCRIISSPLATAEMCFSKRATYKAMKTVVPVPIVFNSPGEIESYPVFVKPDKGYGSRGAKRISSRVQLEVYLEERPDSLMMEYLPGPEFTVDCFTNYEGKMLFAGPRERKRVMNGISVNTTTLGPEKGVFQDYAGRINGKLALRGAWFFQLKENERGELALLEIASRLAGTSSVYRMQGVNFALLSVFDAFENRVEVFPNPFDVEVDRALDSRYKLNIRFDTVYLDLDDTLIAHDRLNTVLMSLLFQFLNDQKKIILITKHKSILKDTLEKYRISGLFHEIIHLSETDKKVDFMKETRAIFIDDSFAERKAVLEKLHIPVFAPDAVECLINDR